MRLDFSSERVLAITAHPDDAELLCGGTLARAAAAGAAVGWVVCCRGDRGVAQGQRPGRELAETRRHEAEAAAAIIGADVFFLDVADGELADSPPLRVQLTDLVRRFAATLVIGHAGNDYHPDHRAASRLAFAASWFAASAGQTTGTPPLAEPPCLWEMDTVSGLEFEPHFGIDITDHLDVKRRMLLSHATQLQRANDPDFVPLDRLMERQAALRGEQFATRWAEAFRWSRVWKRCSAF